MTDLHEYGIMLPRSTLQSVITAENAYLSNHGATDDWKFSATLGAG